MALNMQFGRLHVSESSSSSSNSEDVMMRRRQARRRDIEHSSSDSSDAGTFLVANTPLRVAAPPPKPLPLLRRFTPTCALVEDVFRKLLGNRSLVSHIDGIVKARGVMPLSIEVVARFIYAPDEEIPLDSKSVTVMIIAKWKEAYLGDIQKVSPEVAWEKIVISAKKFIDKVKVVSRELDEVDIGVEMIDFSLTIAKFCGPVPPQRYSPTLDWRNINRKALDILDRFPATKDRVNFLGLMSYGPSPDYKQNPLILFIALNYESDSSKWARPRATLKMMLRDYNIDIYMENNDSMEHYPFNTREWDTNITATPADRGFNSITDEYQQTVGLGDDIGPAHYIQVDGDDQLCFPGFGTLGCWVEVKTLDHNEKEKWTKYALTNYHIVRPSFDGFQLGKDDQGKSVQLAPVKGSVLWNADLKGVYPKSPAAKVPIESPTRRTHSWAVHDLELKLQKTNLFADPARVARIRKALQDKRAFFDENKHIFGTVYCASGYTRRTKDNGRLDWALIKPMDEARIGKNELKTEKEWHAVGYDESMQPENSARMGPNESRALLKDPPKKGGIKEVKNGDVVYKIGSTTGPTGGRFSIPKMDVSLSEDRHVQEFMAKKQRSYLSKEYIFFGMGKGNNILAKKGDSGSVVFDKHGNAIGLLFRGCQANLEADSYAFITPIEDVFADIKAYSGNKILDIRIVK